MKTTEAMKFVAEQPSKAAAIVAAAFAFEKALPRRHDKLYDLELALGSRGVARFNKLIDAIGDAVK